MKSKLHTFLTVLLLILSSAALAENFTRTPDETIPFRTKAEVKFVADMTPENGFDHKAWNFTPGYQFRMHITQVDHFSRAPQEGAEVKYCYNDKYFFILADSVDSDVMTTGSQNQTHLYVMGDLIEVFIKPADHQYYWEVYGSPNNLYTRFYFPSRGRLIASTFGPTDVKIPVTAKVYGTFNDYRDRDKGWKVLICVPIKELEKNGLKFGEGSKWTVFASRYNYSRYLPSFELSSYPQVTGGYHKTEYYADITFTK